MLFSSSRRLDEDTTIVNAEVSGGHDGAAELIVTLRYQNGTVGPVVLDGDLGFALLKSCGAETLDDLKGHSWRKILESLEHV
jgi:hypothetical protein